MTDRATTVVSQPLPVVEALVRDVTGWPALLGEVETVTRLAPGRFTVELHRGRRTRMAVVQVRWNAGEHRFAWRSVSGTAWAGDLHLVPLTGRRTAVHLTLDSGTGRRRTTRFLVRVFRPVRWWARPGTRFGRFGQARRDLETLRRRVDSLPTPVRPPRLVPRQGVPPVPDLLTVAGLRARAAANRRRAGSSRRAASGPTPSGPTPSGPTASGPAALGPDVLSEQGPDA